ncbi:5739_t:CDS:2 [Paraglomus occultum]|uniref:5739_t:CDS:1 n=1 Tax=Paraglomus occultum TaxID=144539 RepID=A0A9N8ZNF2_9GLOM|nr:5739_t:CDS:2 [Paraglomus occultum]
MDELNNTNNSYVGQYNIDYGNSGTYTGNYALYQGNYSEETHQGYVDATNEQLNTPSRDLVETHANTSYPMPGSYSITDGSPNDNFQHFANTSANAEISAIDRSHIGYENAGYRNSSCSYTQSDNRNAINGHLKSTHHYLDQQAQSHMHCESTGCRISSLYCIQPDNLNVMNRHLNLPYRNLDQPHIHYESTGCRDSYIQSDPNLNRHSNPPHCNPVEPHTNPVSFSTLNGPSDMPNYTPTNTRSQHLSVSYILTRESASHRYLVTKVEQTRSVLGMVSAADIDNMLSNVRM